jgi:hypothetical protein
LKKKFQIYCEIEEKPGFQTFVSFLNILARIVTARLRFSFALVSHWAMRDTPAPPSNETNDKHKARVAMSTLLNKEQEHTFFFFNLKAF